MQYSEHIELRRTTKDIVTELVFIELRLGLTFCQSAALHRGGGAKCNQALHFARRAHENAVKYMWRVGLDHPAFNQMTAQCERLKFEIEALAADMAHFTA